MLMVTLNYIPGKEFEAIGIVKGSSIRTVHAGKDIMNGLKTLVGGELDSYNEMMNEARAYATKRMEDDARNLGADAIVTVRYSSSSVAQSAAEVMSYGTAVKFIPKEA